MLPGDLNDLAHVSWVRSVLHRSCPRYHTSTIATHKISTSVDYLDVDLSDVCIIMYMKTVFFVAGERQNSNRLLQSWPSVCAEPFVAVTQFISVGIVSHDLPHHPGIVGGPILVRVSSSGKVPH